MSTAGDVFNLVAAFMDDPERDLCTDAYLQPFVQQCHNRLYQNVYANPNIQGAKQVVVLVGVPVGSTSLGPYMLGSGPLAMLTNVFSMREKPTGSSDGNYLPMVQRQDLGVPYVDDQLPFNGYYVVVKDDILLPGATQVLDMRVYGEFRPVPITSAQTPILQFSETILAHWVCELLGLTRGGTSEFIAYHRGEKDQAIDELFNSLIMDLQTQTFRQRPFGGGCREGYDGEIGPGGPIAASDAWDIATWGP